MRTIIIGKDRIPADGIVSPYSGKEIITPEDA